MEIETHPLEPFLPAKSKLLMLGSFPPQKKRWSMDFYYPNLNNDMWRIYGILFFNDKNHFLNSTLKSFCREQIIDFLNEKGIALFDTASSIRRLQDNASDKFLEVVEATDVAALLRQLPECSHRHYRAKSNGHSPTAIRNRRAESRRLLRVRF